MAKRKRVPQRVDGLRAALYLRISPKKQEESASIEKQRKITHDLASMGGYTVVAEYVDSDSAFDRDDPRDRENYGRMLDSMLRGEIDVVIAYDSDRMWRDDVERGLFMRDALAGGLAKVLSPSGTINPQNASDDFVSIILTAVNKKSSADTSRRVRDENKMKRARGEITRPVNALGRRGNRHPGGRDANPFTIYEPEARMMRDAAKRILAGETAGTLAREWNAARLPKAEIAERAVREGTEIEGGHWTGPEVMNQLTAPWVTGLQMHGGEMIGELVNCPKILDRRTYERLVALKARRSTGPKTVMKTRWTGVFRCGGTIKRDGVEMPCGGVLHHGVARYGVRKYACDGKGCCHSVRIKAEAVEGVAVKAIVEYVEGNGDRFRKRLMNAKVDVESNLDRLLELRAKNEDIDRRNVIGELSDERHARMSKMIDVEIEEMERELQSANVLPAEIVKYLGNGKLLQAALDSGELSPDKHRAIFLATGHFVWVTPRDQARQPRGSKMIDMTRISFDAEHPSKRGRKKHA